MSWNHRVMKRKVDASLPEDAWTTGEYFTIHEVFYNDDGSISNFTTNPTYPSGETLEELKQDYELYAKAFEKEVLDYVQLSKELEEKCIE